MKAIACAVAMSIASAAAMAEPAWCPGSTGDHANEIPRYDHILVIIAENHGHGQIIGNPRAPNLNRLAKTYGSATSYFGVAHPSKPNYIAMLGGDTFGIHDDDAYYCRPGSTDRYCHEADTAPPYVDHTVPARSLMDQLAERQLTWKGYYESIPEPGSKVVYWPDKQHPVKGLPTELYAVKHTGFMQFRSVQDDPARATKIVGFDRLSADLASGQVPNYAHIVPNQCNDMHGRDGANVPPDCRFGNDQGRIRRGDKAIGALVDKIQASPIWSAPGNTAIVITWDEDDGPHQNAPTEGCCGNGPDNPANRGGGHIATIVVTNHGPRGVADPTPHNHYSLLRTVEDAFCIGEYLGQAANSAAGVQSMVKLFQTK
jgi:phosphatidylinositol-3-phosphatase